MSTYTHQLVTEANIDEIREAITPNDQRKAIEEDQVISSWPITGGRITVWYWPGNTASAACCTGGDSVWGTWDDDRGVIVVDGEYEIDRDGNETVL